MACNEASKTVSNYHNRLLINLGELDVRPDPLAKLLQSKVRYILTLAENFELFSFVLYCEHFTRLVYVLSKQLTGP